jgi:hypothetical protein
MLLQVVDLRSRQHAAVADQHHALQREALPQLGDLVRHGRRIAGVARVDLQADRPANA